MWVSALERFLLNLMWVNCWWVPGEVLELPLMIVLFKDRL